MKLVVIIPALNEEKTIGNVIGDIPEEISGINETDVIVVDDGSTDATCQVAEAAGATVISHPTNLGVGTALHTGIEAALKRGADIIVNIDGDGQFDPKTIPLLIRHILENQADFATASRFKNPEYIPEMPRIKKWGNRCIAWLISLLTGQKFHDVSCGYRAYSRDTALRLNLFGKFTYTQETFLDLAFRGLRIVEIPMQIRGQREFGKSRVASNLFRYAINSSKIILRAFRDYKPLRFFGFLAALSGIMGLGFLIFLFGHYVSAGQFTPHKWAGFVGASFIALAAIIWVVGLLGDMLDRIRVNQEEMLYYQRKRELSETTPVSSEPSQNHKR